VKQQCESKQFIAINDSMEMFARVFISNGRCGEESKKVKRQKERVCGSALRGEKDSVGNKIDH
jgi:hypothetical protein